MNNCVSQLPVVHSIKSNQICTSIAPISPVEARLSGAPNKSVSKSENPRFGPKMSTDNRVSRQLSRESQIKERKSKKVCVLHLDFHVGLGLGLKRSREIDSIYGVMDIF